MKKIGIHDDERGFSRGWIEYCKKNNIPYKLVNAYDNNIIDQLSDCSVFMWHIMQGDHRDMLFGKQLLFSLQQKGLKVFPNFNTAWHFDDKLGQKFLLEALDIPLVPTYAFFTKESALLWAKKTDFPKVFKLRGGAGSRNVFLVKNYAQAKRFINKAFGRGFPYFSRWRNFTDHWEKFIGKREHFKSFLGGIWHLLFPIKEYELFCRDKGYAYFQDFVPNNEFDIRVCIVNNQAFALKRMVRENDFRASGSHSFSYDKNQISDKYIECAFDINSKLKSQSLAVDFITAPDGSLLITEISFGFAPDFYSQCEGYWTPDMKWNEGNNFDFYGWMVDEVVGDL